MQSAMVIWPAADAVRLRDLHAAFADDEIDAIFCLRGGYGTPRLLDSVDFELLVSQSQAIRRLQRYHRVALWRSAATPAL
jgi:hypothetical protein